jgi:arylsulfatase A-like enzyme
VPFNAPHTPLQAPKEYLARYADWPDRRRAAFAAMVTCMDKVVGDIVEALAANSYPAENTLFFFCSDNGGIPQFGSNRDLRAGKGTLYEGGVRVPAVMVWKDRIEAGSEVDEPFHIVDLYPTLLNLAGVSTKQPKPLDGKDAWPTIAEGKPSPHEFILHNVTPFSGALRMKDWKIIHNGSVGANSTAPPKQQSWELFNIADDPSEKHDLQDEHPQVFGKLKAKLAELAKTAAPPNIPPNRPPKGFEVPKVWGESN